jgi:hypothetical protein
MPRTLDLTNSLGDSSNFFAILISERVIESIIRSSRGRMSTLSWGRVFFI